MTSPRSTCTDEQGWEVGAVEKLEKGHVHFSAHFSLSLHTHTHTHTHKSLIKSQRLTLFWLSLHFHKGPPGKEVVKRGKEDPGEGTE